MKIYEEKPAFLACLCCTLFSCSNVEKKAGEKLQAAREAFERGDYSEAKIQIDSIKILYPKAFETRREGIGLMQQVELKEQEENAGLPRQYASGKQKRWMPSRRIILSRKMPNIKKSAITCIPHK